MNHLYMDEWNNNHPIKNDNPNIDDAYENCKPNIDEGYELDRGINRCENRHDAHDSCNKADYKRCIVSSSDDASKKRKVISENNVSTMSSTQTSRTSATNANDLKFSIPLVSLNE